MKKIFPVSEFARLPSYGTTKAACFDIRCCLRDKQSIKAVDSHNQKVNLAVVLGQDFNGENKPVRAWSVIIPAGTTAIVPTGLLFHIPDGKQLKLHPRSGIAIKRHLNLANCEGVIDEDYPDETFVPLHNNSQVPVIITHFDEWINEDGDLVEQGGERICQGEFVDYTQDEFEWTTQKDINKDSDRIGGLGSTNTH